jgi:hypothetical protein
MTGYDVWLFVRVGVLELAASPFIGNGVDLAVSPGTPNTGIGCSGHQLSRTNKKSAFIGFYFQSAERHFRILFQRKGRLFLFQCLLVP